MEASGLQEVIRAQPFRPFAIVAADGARIRVGHPEWIAVRGERSAAVFDQDERLHIIDVMLVQRLEIEPPVPTGPPASSSDIGG